MNVRYHADTDSAYITLTEGDTYESEEVAPGVIVDYTEDGVVIGIEIYENARTQLAGSPLQAIEDERALEIGRAWIGGYGAGLKDRNTEEAKSA